MSVPTYLASKLVPMALSTDGITYRNVLCKRTANFTGTTPQNTEESDCGSSTALGENTWSFDFDGLFNNSINTATEYSAVEILNFWISQTLLYVKVAGTGVLISGTGYLTGTGFALQTGQNSAFSFTFTGTGNPTVTKNP